jgi:hypothetical protein
VVRRQRVSVRVLLELVVAAVCVLGPVRVEGVVDELLDAHVEGGHLRRDQLSVDDHRRRHQR